MGFAAYHIEKGTGTGGGMGSHIDRTKGKENTFPHADPERIDFNAHYINKDKNLSECVNARISEGYKGEKAIRKDAVKFLSHVLTGTHEDMVEIFTNAETAKDWIQENYKFMKNEFGKENIVKFALHMDEKTPHLHCITVPLTKDGRLSAKEILGNRIKLSQLQDRYASAMSKFNLIRGLKNTGVKHENAREYYGRMKDIDVDADNLVSKGVLGTNKRETIENYKKAFKSSEIELRMKEKKMLELQKKNNYLTEKIKLKENEFEILKGKNRQTLKRLTEVGRNPEAYKILQEQVQKLDGNNRPGENRNIGQKRGL